VAKNSTKIGLIGVGRWGKNILRTLEEMRGVEVVVGAKTDIDGVVIATPGSTHAKVAFPYIKQGTPTFIEKPLTTNLSDARLLAKTAEQSGAQVTVGHIHLHNPAFLKVKSLLPDIGRIQALHFEGMGPGPVRDDMSVLWDWGPHPLSMALDLLPSGPTQVQAWGELILRPRTHLFDIATMKLTFPRKVTMLCSLSWLSPEKRTKLTVIGSTGSIVLDDRATKKVSLHTSLGKISHPRYGAKQPLTEELREFVAAIQSGAATKADIRSGVESVAILAAAEQSMLKSGRVVQL